MILQVVALFCCGTFFAAVLYIPLAQHPAALQAGAGAATLYAQSLCAIIIRAVKRALP